MLLALIRKEIVGHVLSLRFALTFLLILLLGIVSLALGAYQAAHDREEAEARNRIYRQALERLNRIEDDQERFGRVFWREGKAEAVAAPPLASVVQGMAPTLPAAVSVTAGGWTNIDRAENRNPMIGLFFTPDFAYVVSVVLSLLALLTVFDSVSGEKEEGTLRLILSNAVPRHTVLIAKWVGGLAVLIAPLLIVFGGGVAYVWARGAIELSGESVQRLGVILLAALLYVSLFFSLGLTISCLTHRATTSLFVSLFVWVAWVLAVPNVAPAVAKVIAPAPAMREIDAEKEAVDREIGLRMQRLQQTGDLTYGDKVKREQEKLEQEREDRKARWDKFVGDANRRQDRWAGLLGRLSPSASWIYTASEMSQTGPSVYERFEQARRRMQTGMKSKHDELTKAWQATAFTQAPPIVLETLPSLRMSYPSFSDSLDVALNDLLLLLILNVVFFMLGFMLFLRYDVR